LLAGCKKLTADIEDARMLGFPARRHWRDLKRQKLNGVF